VSKSTGGEGLGQRARYSKERLRAVARLRGAEVHICLAIPPRDAFNRSREKNHDSKSRGPRLSETSFHQAEAENGAVDLFRNLPARP